MQKISDSTTTANPAGEFAEGNPAAGAEATLIKAQWLNTIQRELTGLVLGAKIALSRDNDNQVLEAVNLLAKSAVDPVLLEGGLLVTPQIVRGKLADIPVTKFLVAADDTTDKPVGLGYGCGMHVKFPDGKYGFDLLAGMTTESFHVRKLDLKGVGAWRCLWHDGNFDPSSKADKGTTLSAYGITNAYTRAQTDNLLSHRVAADHITAAGFVAGIADQPYFRAANSDGSEGAVVKLASANHTHTFSSISDRPNNFQEYGIAGGTLTTPVVITTQGQGLKSAGLSLLNDNAGGVCNITLASTRTGVQILHTNGGSGISVVAANSTLPAPVAASAFLANGSACHTEASFMKPVAGKFVSLNGSAIIPAGGTWAFSVTGYNGSGLAVGNNAGVVAGGTAVGLNSNSVGFAWRIQ